MGSGNKARKMHSFSYQPVAHLPPLLEVLVIRKCAWKPGTQQQTHSELSYLIHCGTSKGGWFYNAVVKEINVGLPSCILCNIAALCKILWLCAQESCHGDNWLLIPRVLADQVAQSSSIWLASPPSEKCHTQRLVLSKSQEFPPELRVSAFPVESSTPWHSPSTWYISNLSRHWYCNYERHTLYSMVLMSPW